jgi:hypothetical protein
MWSRALVLAAVATALTRGGAEAQAAPDSLASYHREVFQYQRAGRGDPFRSLTRGEELGVRLEDLALRGVVLHEDPTQSVAVL